MSRSDNVTNNCVNRGIETRMELVLVLKTSTPSCGPVSVSHGTRSDEPIATIWGACLAPARPAIMESCRLDGEDAWRQIRATSEGLAYRIEYSPATGEHLAALSARQRAIVFDTVDEQLVHQPDVETRNRKSMRPNRLAPWELRMGELRVYYEIAKNPENVVTIVAVGRKARNRVLIGGKEIEL